MRRLLAQAGLGALLGWAVLAGLLVTDAAGLARLIAGADLGAVALAVLAVQFAGGFATFTTATALAWPGDAAGQAGRRPSLRRSSFSASTMPRNRAATATIAATSPSGSGRVAKTRFISGR